MAQTVPSTLLMNYDDLAAQGIVGPGSFDLGPLQQPPLPPPMAAPVQSTLSDFTGTPPPGTGADLDTDLTFKGQSLPMQDQMQAAPSPPPLPSALTTANESDLGLGIPDRYPKASTPKQIKEQTKALDEGVGFMPTLIAVAAALNGNFSPAMMLMEQKRKTQLAKFMEPHARAINAHIQAGELKEAGELTDDLMANVAPRSPEIGAYLKEQRADIRHKQGNLNAFKSYITWKDAVLPEEHQDRPKLDAMKGILKTGGGTAEGLLGQIQKELDPHLMINNGQLINVSKATGEMTQTRLNTPFSPEMLKGRVGDTIVAETKMPLDQISDYMNNKPIEGPNGQMIAPDPALRTAIRDRIAELSRTEGDVKLAANIPMSPEAALQGQRQGLSRLQLATRDISPEAALETQAGTLAQEIRKQEAAPLAAIRQNPLAAPQAGEGYMQIAPGADFTRSVESMSLAEAEQRKGEVIRLPTAQILRAQGLNRAITNISEAERMFEMYGLMDNTSSLERAITGINRKFSEVTGYTFKADDTAAKAAQVIANAAIEELGNAKLIPDANMKQLKSMVTGIPAHRGGAMAAIREITQKAQSELGQAIGKQAVERQASVGKYIDQDWYPLAQRRNVPPELVQAILGNEGSGDTQESFKGARGRFQVIQGTATPYLAKIGKTWEDMYDRNVNNYVGVNHIADLWHLYKDRGTEAAFKSVLGAYHAGPNNVDLHGQVRPTVQEPDRPGKPGKHTIDYQREGMEKVYKGMGMQKPKVRFTPSGGG